MSGTDAASHDGPQRRPRLIVEGIDTRADGFPQHLRSADLRGERPRLHAVENGPRRFPPIRPPAASFPQSRPPASSVEPDWLHGSVSAGEPGEVRLGSESVAASYAVEEPGDAGLDAAAALWQPRELTCSPEPGPPVLDRRSMKGMEYGARMRCRAGCFLRNAWNDHLEYYSCASMRDLLIGIGAGSIFANTSWDQDIQDWYQTDVRSRGTDKWSTFWKTFGEGEIFIPTFAGLAVAGTLLDRSPVCFAAGDYGGRVTRGYLVGAPPMLFMQGFLGASRPGETRFGSQWKPFDDTNAVSGHAFMGAVPFITAAKMVDPWWMKGGFYALSTFTAWSRINDDEHYFSQACLGWWMAYLACSAVDRTETGCRRNYALTPLTTPQMCGIALVCRR
jgi:hypothetical protein